MRSRSPTTARTKPRFGILCAALSAGMLATPCPSACVQPADAQSLPSPQPNRPPRLWVCFGMSNYVNLPDLPGADTDAENVCAAAKKAGWSTLTFTEDADLTRDGLAASFEKVKRKATELNTQVISFYNAGHGMQVDGVAYLIPLDGPAPEEFSKVKPTRDYLEVPFYPMSRVNAALAEAGATLRVFWLDQCRDNPYATKVRGAGQSGPWVPTGVMRSVAPLGPIYEHLPTPEGEIYVFATSADKTALNDHTFAKELSRFLDPETSPGNFELRRVARLVIDSVRRQTSTEQTGWTLESVNDFELCVQGPCPNTPPAPIASFAPTRTVGGADPTLAASYPMVAVRPDPDVSFSMGCTPGQPKAQCHPDEKVVKVTLTAPYQLGATEVPVAFWNKVLGLAEPSAEAGKYPKANVTFCDVVVFANRLSELQKLQPAYTGMPSNAQVGDACTWADRVVWDRKADGYRLPTEAEWEYAARAGKDLVYAGSDDLDEVGWADGKVHPVGGKKPNDWGFYDMSGNLWEWVSDAYAPYPDGPLTDPYQPSGGLRVGRGGGTGDSGGDLRVSNRGWISRDDSGDYLGFRLARGVPGPGSAP